MRLSAMVLVAALALMGPATGRAASIVSGLKASAFSQVTYDKSKVKGLSQSEFYGDSGGVPASSTRDPWGGSTFNSFVQTTGQSVFFESSNAVSKIFTKKSNTLSVKTISQTMVSFEFFNDSNEDVRFDSLITAAGVGYYLANTAPNAQGVNCAYSGCPEVTGVSLLKDVAPYTAGSTATDAATVRFDFAIRDFSGSGPTTAGGRMLYDVSGSSSLSFGRDAQGKIYSYYNDNLSDARAKLNGFTLASAASDLATHAYAWDATPVSFMLSPGRHFLTYTTFVSSEAHTHQLACGADLVAFAGFGDPIGRAGAVEGIDAFSADGPSAFALKGCPANGRIKGLAFKPQQYRAPVVKDGKLVYSPTGAVPEPATWATMILGFGAIGTVMRRRRVMAGAA